jgi:hypothetical protein
MTNAKDLRENNAVWLAALANSVGIASRSCQCLVSQVKTGSPLRPVNSADKPLGIFWTYDLGPSRSHRSFTTRKVVGDFRNESRRCVSRAREPFQDQYREVGAFSHPSPLTLAHPTSRALSLFSSIRLSRFLRTHFSFLQSSLPSPSHSRSHHPDLSSSIVYLFLLRNLYLFKLCGLKGF